MLSGAKGENPSRRFFQFFSGFLYQTQPVQNGAACRKRKAGRIILLKF